jgi:hypothetical protein
LQKPVIQNFYSVFVFNLSKEIELMILSVIFVEMFDINYKVMRQLTLSIPDNQFSFFMKIVKAFDFVKVEKTVKIVEPSSSEENKRFLDGISDAVREVNLHKQGKIKLQTLEEVFADFRREGIIPSKDESKEFTNDFVAK